jgi:hypothetical protein
MNYRPRVSDALRALVAGLVFIEFVAIVLFWMWLQ